MSVTIHCPICTSAMAVQTKMESGARFACVGCERQFTIIMHSQKSDETRTKLNQLIDAVENFDGSIVARDHLRNTVVAYEETGDHDHGRGSLPVGAPCPGGDCWVWKAYVRLT